MAKRRRNNKGGAKNKVLDEATETMVTSTFATPAPPAAVDITPYQYQGAYDVPENLYRYWKTRYSLFSLYDSGVALNDEQWYSVTPEAVAVSVAEYLYECQPEAQVIVDGFCGAGGNSIQFARLFPRVISIEIDPVTMACAQQNARVYGVEDKIDFIQGDVFEVLAKLKRENVKVDIIYASPPWGGPVYLGQKVFDLSKMEPYNLQYIYTKFREVCENICLFLPKSSDLQQIADLVPDAPNDDADSTGDYEGERIRVDYLFLKGRCKGLNVSIGPNLLLEVEEESENPDKSNMTPEPVAVNEEGDNEDYVCEVYDPATNQFYQTKMPTTKGSSLERPVKRARVESSYNLNY